jgi:hypothetical protein
MTARHETLSMCMCMCREGSWSGSGSAHLGARRCVVDGVVRDGVRDVRGGRRDVDGAFVEPPLQFGLGGGERLGCSGEAYEALARTSARGRARCRIDRSPEAVT